MKDGEGIRYIDVEISTAITFKEIRETATHLYFEHDASQNSFMEDKTNCLIELISMSAQIFGKSWEIFDPWEFLKQIGLCVFKTFFVLRSKYFSFENDE